MKTWLITGSSRGLGRALVKAALQAGDRVIATARNPSDLRDLAGAQTLALDVTNEASIKAAIAEAGRIDVLVNNAGYANLGAFEDVPADDFRAQIETNFFGVVNVTRAVLPLMRAQKSGHIIQISSLGGRFTSLGLTAYQAAKFAVGGFSEGLAKEVASLGIKVTIVEPGGIDTDWSRSSMRVFPPSTPYAETVGAFNKHVRANGVLRGDPANI
jgi:NAD(P)-dependent dehydrogenase (short-subunit alcohol dehydrogenase family)